MKRMLMQVAAPNFTAGVELEADFRANPVNAEHCQIAPILRFMRGWSLDEIERYCYAKGWKLQKA